MLGLIILKFIDEEPFTQIIYRKNVLKSYGIADIKVDIQQDESSDLYVCTVTIFFSMSKEQETEILAHGSCIIDTIGNAIYFDDIVEK